jgi:hypothetical protein
MVLAFHTTLYAPKEARSMVIFVWSPGARRAIWAATFAQRWNLEQFATVRVLDPKRVAGIKSAECTLTFSRPCCEA